MNCFQNTAISIDFRIQSLDEKWTDCMSCNESHVNSQPSAPHRAVQDTNPQRLDRYMQLESHQLQLQVSYQTSFQTAIFFGEFAVIISGSLMEE
jgi:hypothetical protein